MSFNPYLLLLLLSVVLSSFSQIFLKKSALQKHESVIKEYLNFYVIFGYMLLFGTTLLNIFAFSKGVEYKNGPVIETLAFILVMFLSKLFFQEEITKRKALGNLLILLGVVIFYL